jgi:hypothetical protein
VNVKDRYEWLMSDVSDPDQVKRFYEGVYRGCLNPLERLKRFVTHKSNGDRRFQ